MSQFNHCARISTHLDVQVFISFKATELTELSVLKKVPEDIFHPLKVLMWQFNDLLTLRRFSLRGGNNTPDESDIA